MQVRIQSARHSRQNVCMKHAAVTGSLHVLMQMGHLKDFHFLNSFWGPFTTEPRATTRSTSRWRRFQIPNSQYPPDCIIPPAPPPRSLALRCILRWSSSWSLKAWQLRQEGLCILYCLICKPESLRA